MNAKQELVEACPTGCTIRCAQIKYAPEWDVILTLNLPLGWDNADMLTFMKQLSGVDYDEGYGSQHLFGVVWFTDATWLERHEYDGAERWVYKKTPTIPAELQGGL